MTSSQQLMNEYIAWTKEKFKTTDYKSCFEIRTPFLDNLDDNISLIVRKDDDDITIDDDGNTLNNLEMFGIDLSTKSRKKELNSIKEQFGVYSPDDRFMVKGKSRDFPRMMQRIINALIRIDGMSMLKKETVADMFYDDVYSFFNENNFNGETNKVITGKSGVKNKFDYAMMNDNFSSLIYLKNNVDLESIQVLLFRFADVAESLNKSNKLSIIFNDQRSKITNNIKNLAKTYRTNLVPFSEKDKVRKLKAG